MIQKILFAALLHGVLINSYSQEVTTLIEDIPEVDAYVKLTSFGELLIIDGHDAYSFYGDSVVKKWSNNNDYRLGNIRPNEGTGYHPTVKLESQAGVTIANHFDIPSRYPDDQSILASLSPNTRSVIKIWASDPSEHFATSSQNIKNFNSDLYLEANDTRNEYGESRNRIYRYKNGSMSLVSEPGFENVSSVEYLRQFGDRLFYLDGSNLYEVSGSSGSQIGSDEILVSDYVGDMGGSSSTLFVVGINSDASGEFNNILFKVDGTSLSEVADITDHERSGASILAMNWLNANFNNHLYFLVESSDMLQNYYYRTNGSGIEKVNWPTHEETVVEMDKCWGSNTDVMVFTDDDSRLWIYDGATWTRTEFFLSAFHKEEDEIFVGGTFVEVLDAWPYVNSNEGIYSLNNTNLTEVIPTEFEPTNLYLYNGYFLFNEKDAGFEDGALYVAKYKDIITGPGVPDQIFSENDSKKAKSWVFSDFFEADSTQWQDYNIAYNEAGKKIYSEFYSHLDSANSGPKWTEEVFYYDNGAVQEKIIIDGRYAGEMGNETKYVMQYDSLGELSAIASYYHKRIYDNDPLYPEIIGYETSWTPGKKWVIVNKEIGPWYVQVDQSAPDYDKIERYTSESPDYTWNKNDKTWESTAGFEDIESEYIYNANGQPEWRYDFIYGNTSDTATKVNYIYNDKGELSEELFYSLNPYNGNIGYSGKFTHMYSEDGVLTQSTKYDKNDNYDYKYEYGIDIYNRNTEKRFTWNGTSWILDYHSYYEYDEEGRITAYYLSRDDYYEGVQRYEYTYDPQGNLLNARKIGMDGGEEVIFEEKSYTYMDGIILTYEALVLDHMELGFNQNKTIKNDYTLVDGQYELLSQVKTSYYDSIVTYFSYNINDDGENQEPEINAQTFSIDENSAKGILAGTVSTSDPDGDTLTFSLVSGNTDEAFALGTSDGELAVNNSAALDYETTPTFNLVVQVDDSAGGSAQANIIVNINDIEEVNAIAQTDVSEKIRAYPNPAKGPIFIQTNGLFTKVDYHLFNSSGQLIQSGKGVNADEFSIHLPSTKGLYLLRLMQNNHYAFIKLMKE